MPGRAAAHARRAAHRDRVVALLFVLQPQCVAERVERVKGRLAVLLDTSRSMTVRDGERTRAQGASDSCSAARQERAKPTCTRSAPTRADRARGARAEDCRCATTRASAACARSCDAGRGAGRGRAGLGRRRSLPARFPRRSPSSACACTPWLSAAAPSSEDGRSSGSRPTRSRSCARARR